jgi:chromosome segregation ATPase
MVFPMKNKSPKTGAGVFGAAFLLLVFGSVSIGEGAIYKYKDKNGTTHFTDRYESIPREYRNQIETIRETAKPDRVPQPAEEQAKEEGKAKPAEAAAGVAEKEKALKQMAEQEAKQKEFDEKVKRIEDLKKEIADREKELQGLRTTWMVFDRQAVFRINQEIAELRSEIEEIQKELAEIK